MFDNNFGKCAPIFKILSPVYSQGNSLCIHQKDFYLTYKVLLLPCESRKSKNATDFDSIINKLLTYS